MYEILNEEFFWNDMYKFCIFNCVSSKYHVNLKPKAKMSVVNSLTTPVAIQHRKVRPETEARP